MPVSDTSCNVRWLAKHLKIIPVASHGILLARKKSGTCTFLLIFRHADEKMSPNDRRRELKIYLFIYRPGSHPSLEENTGFIVLRRLDSWYVDMIVRLRAQHPTIHPRMFELV